MQQQPLKAWILLDYDMPYLRKVIQQAPEYNIEQIQLSHHICMFAEQVFDEPQRHQDLQELIALGNRLGLEMFIWSHEVAAMPDRFVIDGKVNLDDPEFYQWIIDKYDRLFTMLPGLSGIVMTYAETDVKPFDDGRTISKMSHAERITKLTNTIYEACQKHGKKLIARDWANVGTGSWDALMEFEKGLRESHPDIMVMTKHTAGDWYLLADNPLMGMVKPHVQLCEFDLAGEHHGKQVVPWCHPDYIRDRWNWAHGKGANGAAARLERYDRHLLGTPGEVNLFAFSRILDYPEMSTDVIWHTWATQEFGAKAAPKVVSALKRTDAIILKTFYARRAYWGSNHSRIPYYSYLHRHLRNKTAVPFDESFKPIEESLLNPDESTLEWVLAEKDEAIALCDASLQDIEDARVHLKERDYLYLKDALERSRALAHVFRGINETYFHVTFIQDDLNGKRKYWVEQFQESIQRLEDARDAVFSQWGTDFVLGHSPERRNHFGKTLNDWINDMRKRVREATGEESEQ